MLTQVYQTPEQQRWAFKLQGFSFEIHYKPGRSNRVVDALSRVPSASEALFLHISTPIPSIIEELMNFYQSDPTGIACWQQHSVSPGSDSNYHATRGLIFHRNRIFVPDVLHLRRRLLHEFHATPSAGHSGSKATRARLAGSFSWPSMSHDVKTFIRECQSCQHNKSIHKKKDGFLQPLPQPRRVWEDINMDFVTHLPSSFGHTVIWVVVDRLSKYVHFLALPTKFSAAALANRFSTDVYRFHGTPRSIVSDRDSMFLSQFWRELFRIQGTTLKFLTAYHPETDGQTEVVNRSLSAYLRCVAGDLPRRWYSVLHLAEFWYNTSYHSAIGTTPFQALYGRPPPVVRDYILESSTDTAVESLLQDRTTNLRIIKEHMCRTQQRMRDQANKGRINVTFEVGDWVLLKTHLYRQRSLARPVSHKLGRRYHGPFQVICRIGAVAYELSIPEQARLHTVFHVSLLWCFHGVPPSTNPSSSIQREASANPNNALALNDLQMPLSNSHASFSPSTQHVGTAGNHSHDTIHPPPFDAPLILGNGLNSQSPPFIPSHFPPTTINAPNRTRTSNLPDSSRVLEDQDNSHGMGIVTLPNVRLVRKAQKPLKFQDYI
uniref:Retrotransposable element Tf2 n=1 Tax=Cajanus cajan TaxID=3821 RepID=A0A151R4R5_CAJCA|nr:Retrotransposable element Tf2 [Cajanus cajan]